MKEYIIKWAVKLIAGINSKNFETIIKWIVDAGKNENLKGGLAEANYVASQYNKEFAMKASYIVKTVVQIAYFIAKLRGLDT